ncbi:molybdopterin molybdotransferase MoeA [Sandaracinobacteroides saxicola]|uniref:Molybdopterin molybdenumtransferase n=1 Tax=Sandaracinobacteroides saxicola TaxID=2759707 RepID=A0A7G5IEI3_9SPHN|nr:gephyrin-like molybdotransferase Glp [Sandaracinobacteroides saxicola]QMW21775.1 molybdopterin molybdotransferase MoeA [Sandaracinobacteroides saxicola]
MPPERLSVDAAQARLLATPPLPAETVPLADAANRVLAADLAFRLTQPPFAASAMDGYAIRWQDMPGPWSVVGEAAAGHPWTGMLGPHEGLRIFTGAPVPAGADTVIVQEDTHSSAGTLTLTRSGPAHAGAHIRPAGLDFAAGAPALPAGTRLTPARLGLLAAGGHATLPVHCRPRVTLIATGDELVPPGTTPAPGQIISSNGAMLAALLTATGAIVTDAGIVADDRETLAQALQSADADILVTIGGASVGDHDLIHPVLTGLGARLDFWKLALKPGKPLLAGTLGGTRVIGLPGNPVSAFVCALLFVAPLIRHLSGDPHPLPFTETARLTAPLPANGDRRDHLRATLGPDGVTPAPRQDSSMLTILATADALIVRPENAPAAGIGEAVHIIRL